MYAILQIPLFPLQALRRRMRVRPRGPVAVIDDSGEQSRIISMDKTARGFGIVEGMRPPQAVARCADLVLLPRSISAESEAERMLLLLAQTLSPRIEATRAGLVTVDLRGTRENETVARCETLVERLRGLGLHVRIGIADTPDHAFWATHFARPIKQVRSVETFLQRLPVSVAQVPEEIAGILDGWGIHHLAAFKRLPREEVGARLGRQGLDLWDAVAGRRVRLLKLHEAEPRFERSRALDFRVESLDALLFILKRFVEELAVELAFAHAAAFILKIRLRLENKEVMEKRIEVPEPSGRVTTLFRILETALEGMQTRSAIIGVHLKLETTEARVRQSDLFAVSMEDAVGFAETADRIAAVVGPGRSGSPRMNQTWKPDSFRIENLATEIPDGPEGRTPRSNIGLPLSRFRPPRMVRVFLQAGRPAAVEAAECSGTVCRREGPWRLSSGWWDTDAWTREEWDIELEQGGLFRLFRDGNGWFVEGVYG